MLKLINVKKSFGNNLVLKNITAQFLNQKTTVILGPSGSGKSTMLRSLNFLEHPESGHYLFDGQDIDFEKKISNKTILKVRKKTEMVFQEYNLFPHLTVLGNVIEGPIQVLHKKRSLAQKEASKLLNEVGLKNKINVYPHQLSGGQAQRVAIVRSLAMHPEYILLDEPTSALDPEIELEILKILTHLAKKRQSLIIVTHNLVFAKKVADRIFFLEDGKLLFNGLTNDFFKTNNSRIKNFISALTFRNLI